MSPEVLSQMKTAMQESSSSAASHSFLLDDDSAIPFNHADVERMVDDAVGGSGGGGGGWEREQEVPLWREGGCAVTTAKRGVLRPPSVRCPPPPLPQDLLGETPVPTQLQEQPSFSFLRKPLELALQAAG